MSNRRQIAGMFLILGTLLFMACAPKATPVPAPQAPAAAPAPAKAVAAAPVVPARPAWEAEWDRVLEAARKEGVVAFGTSAGNTPARELSVGFKNAYGLRSEILGGTAGTIGAKILAERRAGLHLWDVGVTGTATLVTVMKPAGATSPLEPALILPDLTVPEVIKKVWYDGKLPWVDQERHLIGANVSVFLPIGINTNLVRREEIQVWDDLLNPKWKGKILFMDPTQPGTPSDSNVMPMLYELKGEAWVRKLAAQEPFIIGDDRLGQEWLAHGKYPIFIPPRQAGFMDLIQAGAPVATKYPKDMQQMSMGPACVTLINNAPHPNAAKVFINWLLSKEGQTIFSKARLAETARLDVPTDFLPAETIRQPGQEYWLRDREETLMKVPGYREKSKEIFGNLIKK